MKEKEKQPCLEDETYRQALIDGELNSPNRDVRLEGAFGMNELLENHLLCVLNKLNPEKGFSAEEQKRFLETLRLELIKYCSDEYKKLVEATWKNGVLYQEMLDWLETLRQAVERDPIDVEEIKNLFQRGLEIKKVLRPLSEIYVREVQKW